MSNSLQSERIGLLQTVLDPDTYEVLPPNISTRTTFAKRFTVNGSWTVIGTGDLAGEKVPSATGLLLWFVQRGVNSIYRFGIVPPTSTSNVFSSYMPFVSPMSYASFKITYNQEVCLPYSSGTNQQILVSPDASKDFTFTRLVAGVISLASEDVPIGSTSLTGNITAGTIQDFRDIAQNLSGVSFAASDIKQQTVTAKDSYVKEQLECGYAAIVGSDIPVNFTVPNRDDFDEINGGNEYYPEFMSAGQTTTYAAGTAAYAFAVQYSDCWVSPWNTTLGGASVIPGCTQLTMGNVSPFDTIDISVALDTVKFQASTVSASFGTVLSLQVTFVDVYASVINNGQIVYHTASETVPIIIGVINSAETAEYEFKQVYYAHHSAQTCQYYQSIPTETGGTNCYGNVGTARIDERGMYVGTYTCVSFLNNYLSVTATDLSLSINAIRGQVKARSIYSEGNLGPIRVCRYDNVGAQQTITVNGSLLLECVPEGQIAPFVTPSMKSQGFTTHVDLFILLAALFTGPGPVKRVWKKKEYERFLENVVPHLGGEVIMEWAKNNPALLEAAHAAGVFGSLGSRLGGALGAASPLGPLGGMLGSTLGGMGGGMLDNMLSGNASGQFGSAAGQFGNAAGQFGNASGMFGPLGGMLGMSAGQFGEASGCYGNKRGRESY